jgi:alpha-mannosidase
MAGKESGIETILRRWREEIKAKQRRIISFEETVDIKIASLRRWISPETVPLDGWEVREFQYTRHRERVFKDKTWRPIRVGETWGGPDTSALFRCKARMPASLKGRKVVLKIYVGGDGLLSVNGKPYHGLDPFRDTVPLTRRATGRERYDFQIESYIFWHFGESQVKTVEASHFAAMDPEMNDTYWDFRAAFNVMMVPGQDPLLLEFLKAGLAKAIGPIDQNETDPARARANARRARQMLRREIYQSDRFRKPGLLHLCGNSHLDIVFLWTHAEFVRKLGRTHATALRLLEEYPEFIFSQSQPLMYQEMKEKYPDMYKSVQRRVKEGRWEVIGAMWVEPDCNLISGESFVRQILHGVRFIEKEFGITPRTCWCPDVFGNLWTMPQILAKCGLRYFVTHKMVVWNDTNPWTKNTFWWQGPDGSRVLALVPPTHFIGTCEPDHMAKHWANFSDQGTIGESLYNYGWGDGGGGPDAEMLEYLKRYGDFPGVVPARPNTIEGALDSIHAKAVQTDLPVVNDELYLEEHRGTFTTKARLKKLNRRAEFLYREAELWSTFARRPYPRKRLNAGWKDVLNNQFHDSLPGSHITPVYEDLLEAYDRAMRTGEAVRHAALDDIASRIDTRGEGQAVVVFNSLAQKRDALVGLEFPKKPLRVLDEDGREAPHQFITHYETGRRLLVFAARDVPQVGWKVYRIVPGRARGQAGAESGLKVRPDLLENNFLRVRLNKAGEIVSLLDKETGRECFGARRRGNVLKLYEDVPGRYEAWDIAPSYTQVEFPLGPAEIRVLEEGPVRAAVEVRRRFRQSQMRQRIVLGADSRRVDFETWVDWKEQQKLLKVRFFTPLITRVATYDIAYGNIGRSACRNNSYEEARFEVPAHLWMDLSQPDFGLSLLNDSKYGHEALDGMMALTLLRGPLNPDPQSDQEEHWFTYSLYPHAGDWREGHTMQEALDLNCPVIAVPVSSHAGSLPAEHSMLELKGEAVTLEAVKKAEDSEDLVVRVVERHGATGQAALRFATPLRHVRECNLLERDEKPIAFAGESVEITINPYEIRTFKVTPGAPK